MSGSAWERTRACPHCGKSLYRKQQGTAKATAAALEIHWPPKSVCSVEPTQRLS